MAVVMTEPPIQQLGKYRRMHRETAKRRSREEALLDEIRLWIRAIYLY